MTMMKASRIAAAAALAATPAGVLATDEYRLDDGVKELGVGIQATGSNSIAWLNNFTASATEPTITDIRVAFGGGLLDTNIPNGTTVDLYVWGDFNQDGDPSDAFVLETTSGVVANTGGNGFNTYTLPSPVTLNPGDSFFAGAIINYSGQFEVASMDDDGTDDIVNYPPMNHSWLAGSANGVPVDPNNLGAAQLPVDRVSNALAGIPNFSDGTWMVRLNAVPGPATAAPLTALAVIAGRRRRR